VTNTGSVAATTCQRRIASEGVLGLTISMSSPIAALNRTEILACDQAYLTVTPAEAKTSGASRMAASASRLHLSPTEDSPLPVGREAT